MNKPIGIALLLILGSLGVRLLYRSLVSEETKIRWVVQGMAEGFDEGRAGQAIAGLASDWTHEGGSVDRDRIRGFVFRERMQNSEPESGAFRWDVELPEDTFRIELGPAEESATVTTDVVFSYLSRVEDGEPRWEPRWHLRLEAEFARTDDGWAVVRSRHEDVEGVMLGR